MRYDEMMGLESYGGGGLGAWMDGQMLKEHLMAGAVGGGGILVVSSLLNYANRWQPTTGMFAASTDGGPANWKRAKAALAAVIGVLGGRAMYDRNRDAAMAFVGGVTGMGLASLVASWIPAGSDGTVYVKANLEGGHLSGADLRALEMAVSTPMASWRPSYDMAGTVAQSRGLQSPQVTDTVLGYQPWNS